MATFKVTLKRTYFAEVEITADSAAEIRKLLADSSDEALDYIGTSNNIWGDKITVSKIERATEAA
jgi:hypothetical protein